MPVHHRIQTGDSVLSLARRHGFLAETIWDAPENGELRERREDMNTLLPGDVLVIPDKRVEPVARPTGRAHRFRVKGTLAALRMQLFDFGQPRAGQDFVLSTGTYLVEGTTDGDGMLEARVPALATSGTLVVGEDQFVMGLLFGHLDPASELSGIQQRLINLGYTCRDESGELGESTRLALREFQMSQELELTGEVDDATRARVIELHDGKVDAIPSAHA